MSSVLRFLSLSLAAVVGGLSALALLGSLFDCLVFLRVYENAVPLAFNTNLCFIFCAASLALAEAEGSIIGSTLATIVAAVGILTFAERLTNADWGVSAMFVPFFAGPAQSEVGTMALNSSFGFIMIGVALAIGVRHPGLSASRLFAVALLGSTVLALGAVPLISYATGMKMVAVWGGMRMPFQAAICFTLIGAGTVLLAMRRTEGLPLWLPFATFVAILVLATSIAQNIGASQTAKVNQIVRSETEQITRAFGQYTRHLYEALDRFAELWQAQGGMAQEPFESYAAAYLRGFPPIDDLIRVDSAGQVRWAADSGKSFGLREQNLRDVPEVAAALNRAAATKTVQITPTGLTLDGVFRHSFAYVRPLFAGDRFDGSLVAVIDVARLFRTLLVVADMRDLSIAVNESGQTIFASSGEVLNAADSSATESRIKYLGQNWQLVAMPTPDLIRSIHNSAPSYIALAGIFIASLLGFSVFLAMRRWRDIQSVRQSEERLALAVSGTSDGLWDCDIGSGRTYFSPRFMEMLGVPMSDSMPDAAVLFDMVHPDDREFLISSRSCHLRDHEPFDTTVRVLHRDGHVVWLNLRGQAVWDRFGKAARMTGFATDVSHQKEVERLQGEFVANFSHELRTPLTSIRGALALIRSGSLGAAPVGHQRMAEIAMKNCERLILLINAILDISTIESGQSHFETSTLGLNGLLQDAVASHPLPESMSDIKLLLEPIEPEAYLVVDANRFVQAINNLISNAVKFSPAKGTVTVNAARHRGKVRVCVTDQGPGIPPAFQSRLFEKFAQADGSSTRQHGGTGLGLNIAQQIIRRFGGEIGCDTEVGKGTTFWVDLPEVVEVEAPTRAGAPAQTHDAQLPSTVVAAPMRLSRILHVEDDSDLRQVIALLLKEKAIVVQAATIAQARKYLTESGFDLIILDLDLPDGSGRSLLDLLGAAKRPLVLVLTGADVEESVRERAAAILVKSCVTEQEIVGTVTRLLTHQDDRQSHGGALA